jgi:hypothetical protein
MHKHLIVGTALAACLGLMTLAANATPISPNLPLAAGSSSYTFNVGPFGSLNLSGWEYDNQVWTPANLTYKAEGPNETGLGVACNTNATKCGQDEINSTPWQIIAVNLSALSGYSQLALGVGSVDGDGGNGLPETAYLFGATCLSSAGTPNSPCLVGLLGSYTYTGGARIHSFDFTKAGLSGLTSIWVTPFLTGDPATQGNVLLSSLSLSVPEPGILGMFGLGVLLIGVFAGLRKRTH